MKRSYIDYAMSVIIGRALPDVRDGMKPVHRRVLYGMWESGNTSSKPYKKSARIVGSVMGKYHPHGDSAIYDTMVRMAQDFSLRYPLVDGQGNFGSIDGDSAAAMRYTEVRLTKIAEEMLREDIDKETVDCGRQLRRVRDRAGGAAGAGAQPADQRRRRHRGGHGHQHPAAQPRRGGRRAAAADRRPRDHHRRADGGHPGPRLPHRRVHPRPRRHPPRLPHRPGHASRCVPAPPSRAPARATGSRSSSPRSPTRSTRPSCSSASPTWSARSASRASATCATSPTARACASWSSSRRARSPR